MYCIVAGGIIKEFRNYGTESELKNVNEAWDLRSLPSTVEAKSYHELYVVDFQADRKGTRRQILCCNLY